MKTADDDYCGRLKSVHKAITTLCEDLATGTEYGEEVLITFAQIAARADLEPDDVMNPLIMAIDEAATRLLIETEPQKAAYLSLLEHQNTMGHHQRSYPADVAIGEVLQEIHSRDSQAVGMLWAITKLIDITLISAEMLPKLHGMLSAKGAGLKTGSKEWFFLCLVDLEDRIEKAKVSEVID